jgi:protease-4
VFGAIPTFEKSLAELGIYSDGVGTTALAAGLNLTQPLPPQLLAAVQQTVEFTYGRFLQIVAEGRELDSRDVAELAEGRVYDGATAKSLGLVDSLGSLQEALDAAAKLAGLDEYRIERVASPHSLQKRLFQYFSSQMTGVFHSAPGVPSGISTILTTYRHSVGLFTDPRGIYAHCELTPAL